MPVGSGPESWRQGQHWYAVLSCQSFVASLWDGRAPYRPRPQTSTVTGHVRATRSLGPEQADRRPGVRTQRVPGIALPRGTHRRPRAHGSGAFPESLCPEGRTGGPERADTARSQNRLAPRERIGGPDRTHPARDRNCLAPRGRADGPDPAHTAHPSAAASRLPRRWGSAPAPALVLGRGRGRGQGQGRGAPLISDHFPDNHLNLRIPHIFMKFMKSL